MSALRRRIAALPVIDAGADYVVKSIGTHEFASLLPRPRAFAPYTSLPDVPVRVTLSTSRLQPAFIAAQVAQCKDQIIFGDNGLAGLCLNGLGPEPAIFIHAGLLDEEDPTGEAFEEFAWHEFVHGCEGLMPDGQRDVPASFRLRELMLDFDRAARHVPEAQPLCDEPAASWQFLRYLREGTILQGHACEMFARVAVLDYLIVRHTGQALDAEAFESMVRRPSGILAEHSAFRHNRWELAHGIASYSEPSQDFFWHMLPLALISSRMMYGLWPDGLKPPKFPF